MEEKDNKEKKTHSEKRATRLQNKLTVLRQRLDKNPPSAVMGREHMFKKLNILEAKVDGQIDLNNRKTLFGSEVFNEDDRYYRTQTEISDSITDLSMKRNAILNEIDGLKHEKSKQGKQQRRIIGKMSKRYRSQLGAIEGIDKVRMREQELREEVQGINSRIKELEGLIGENVEKYLKNKKAIERVYRKDLRQIRKDNKERLAKANPNLFRRIGNWVQERRERSAKMLMEALAETEQASKREMFLQSNAANTSLREQANNVAKAREGFSDRKEYKTMQVAREIQSSGLTGETQDDEWLPDIQEQQEAQDAQEYEQQIEI